MKSLIPIFFLVSMLFVSGCTSDTASNTGQITETAKLTITDTKEAQAPESIEELHKEFEEFEKSQSESSSSPEQNETAEEPNEEESGEQGTAAESTDIPQEEAAEEQPPERSCPSCEDSNPCTTDSCSEETDYECKHEAIIPCCGNGECEETESWSACQEDCECALDCGPCEIPDSGTCSCIPKTVCVQDGCCPGNCTYLEDLDCPGPSMVFSEIYFNPLGNDGDHEWLEIYNNGIISVDITKLKFNEDEKNHTLKSITEDVLEPESYAVIAENTTQFLEDYPGFDGLLFDSSWSSLSNAGELLSLVIDKDGILDSVSYNSSWGGDSTGFSIEKIDLNGPNAQENWNESTHERGTPGQKNSLFLE